MNCCCYSLSCRCVRTVCVSAFVGWFALLAVAPPKIRHEHPVTAASPSVTHHGHSYHTHHHHHADLTDTTKTLTAPYVHWHVWLAGFHWTFPTGHNPSDGPDDESARLIVASVLSHFSSAVSPRGDLAPTQLVAIQQKSYPTAIPVALLWRDPWRTGPPLCDAACGLRSGVQQV